MHALEIDGTWQIIVQSTSLWQIIIVRSSQARTQNIELFAYIMPITEYCTTVLVFIMPITEY